MKNKKMFEFLIHLIRDLIKKKMIFILNLIGIAKIEEPRMKV